MFYWAARYHKKVNVVTIVIQSTKIASHAGRDTERVVKDATLPLLERDARIRAAVRGGRPTGRNSPKRKRWMRAHRMLRS